MLYEGLLNYATDKRMTDPTAYADAEIGQYAFRPEMGYTDWRKELLRTAVQQNYEASVSGGNARTSFYASLGYDSQEGLARNSSLDRYSARLNVSQKVGKYGEVGGNMMFSQMNQEMNEERGSAINPFLCVAMTMNPSMLVRDENGNYTGAYSGTSLNPLRDILTDYNRTRMTRMFSTGYAAIEPIKGLKLKETLSYDYAIQKDSRYYNPLSSAGPKSGSDAQSAKGFIEYGKLISSTSVNYVRTFGQKHHLDVLAAYEIENYQTDKTSGERSKMPSNAGLQLGGNYRSKALEYLNAIVTNRTDPSKAVADADFTLNRVLKERRKELVGEGLVFYDYTRNRLPIERKGSWHLNTLDPSNARIINPDDSRLAVPIPQSEIDANPNLGE